MLIRCGEPSKYDHAPYGTLCKVNKPTSEGFELYLQAGNEESEPQWQKIGDYTAETIDTALDQIASRLLSR